MKFDNLKAKIYEIVQNSFEFESDTGYVKELTDLADESIKYKGIIRMKRSGVAIDRWKTIVTVEIDNNNETEGDQDIKVKLKSVFGWIASIKESIIGTENADLYLFLALSDALSKEECLRIEATEQFCRKYVLLPHEDISQFLNRTFLHKLEKGEDGVAGKDPLENAFEKTADQFHWLTQEMQKKWKKAFSELSGSELSDVILEKEALDEAY